MDFATTLRSMIGYNIHDAINLEWFYTLCEPIGYIAGPIIDEGIRRHIQFQEINTVVDCTFILLKRLIADILSARHNCRAWTAHVQNHFILLPTIETIVFDYLDWPSKSCIRLILERLKMNLECLAENASLNLLLNMH